MERLRSADWIGVLGEIAIVVLGILIAFQLDRWGQDQSKRQNEAKLLDRLAEESAGDLKALEAIREDHLGRARETMLVARAVAGDRLAIAALGTGVDNGCGILRLPSVRLANGELGEKDPVDSLSDERLRDLLRRAMGDRAFDAQQLDYFRASFQRFGQVLDPYMQWRIVEDGQSCRVRIDALRADEAAVSLLARVYRDQQRFVEYRSSEINSLKAVQRRVACLRQGNCR